MSIFGNRIEEDEIKFMDFLDNLKGETNFGIILEVSGEKGFSATGKRNLNLWFKNNKDLLSKECIGFVRIRNGKEEIKNQIQDRIASVFPCPYLNVNCLEDAQSFLAGIKHE